MTDFHTAEPGRAACWRAVVLFGQNSASYKFALAQALIELAPAQPGLVRLEELALPFARRICAHLSSTLHVSEGCGRHAWIQKNPSEPMNARASPSDTTTGPKSPGAPQASRRHHATWTRSPSPVGRSWATGPPVRRLYSVWPRFARTTSTSPRGKRWAAIRSRTGSGRPADRGHLRR